MTFFNRRMPYTLTVTTKSKETRIATTVLEDVTDIQNYLEMVIDIWNTHWKGGNPPTPPGIELLNKIGKIPSTIMKISYPDGFHVEIVAIMNV